jgi:hypothetical protein
MRKLIMILTLTMSILGLTVPADALQPPTCGDNCPFVR